MKRITKEEMFLKMAFIVSERSTCKRLSVGAIITDENLWNVTGIGYNGGYAGGPNSCTGEAGNCGDLHSEINALIKNGGRGTIMFLTDSPCEMCAKAIINGGIKRIYFSRRYRNEAGIKLLKNAGVKVKQLKLGSSSY